MLEYETTGSSDFVCSFFPGINYGYATFSYKSITLCNRLPQFVQNYDTSSPVVGHLPLILIFVGIIFFQKDIHPEEIIVALIFISICILVASEYLAVYFLFESTVLPYVM